VLTAGGLCGDDAAGGCGAVLARVERRAEQIAAHSQRIPSVARLFTFLPTSRDGAPTPCR